MEERFVGKERGRIVGAYGESKDRKIEEKISTTGHHNASDTDIWKLDLQME